MTFAADWSTFSPTVFTARQLLLRNNASLDLAPDFIPDTHERTGLDLNDDVVLLKAMEALNDLSLSMLVTPGPALAAYLYLSGCETATLSDAYKLGWARVTYQVSRCRGGASSVAQWGYKLHKSQATATATPEWERLEYSAASAYVHHDFVSSLPRIADPDSLAERNRRTDEALARHTAKPYDCFVAAGMQLLSLDETVAIITEQVEATGPDQLPEISAEQAQAFRDIQLGEFRETVPLKMWALTAA